MRKIYTTTSYYERASGPAHQRHLMTAHTLTLTHTTGPLTASRSHQIYLGTVLSFFHLIEPTYLPTNTATTTTILPLSLPLHCQCHYHYTATIYDSVFLTSTLYYYCHYHYTILLLSHSTITLLCLHLHQQTMPLQQSNN